MADGDDIEATMDGIMPTSGGVPRRVSTEALVETGFHYYLHGVSPDDGLLAYVGKLGETAKLRPDMRLTITRGWNTPEARLHGVLQLSRGLAKVAA